MIYTITLNPSLDYIVKVEELKLGVVNRTCEELILPGGKGLNVSMVLGNLGVDSVAIGFSAGFTGRELERRLIEKGVRTDFITLPEGMNRINVKVRGEAETEINGMGPRLDEAALNVLYEKLSKLGAGDYLILAGSIPAGMPKTIYADVMERLTGKGISFIVDATGEALKMVLPHHPFLIKPNHHELGELFGVDLNDGEAERILPYAKKLQEMGAENVLISMGGKGGLLLTASGEFYRSAAPSGQVINTVGAGDSMVAGFMAGLLAEGEDKKDYQRALRWGICTGSASAFSYELATREAVLSLLES